MGEKRMKNESLVLGRFLLFFMTIALVLFGGNPLVTHAATTAPDTTSPRSITIHAISGEASSQNQLGDNNGSELSTIGQQLLENIRFNAVKVQPIAGQSPVTINPNDPSTYNVVGSVISGTTDSNGTAVLPIGASDANDGYYLVRQATQSGGITTISPFIVQMPYDDTSTNPDGTWVYDVNVYPKLAGSGSKGSDKLIDLGDGTQTNKQSSVFAGGDVTWNLVTVFSPSMRAIQEGSPSPTTVYGSFLLTDQLSDNLVYESISFDVGLQSTTDNTVSAVTSLNFISGTDYTLNTTNNQLTLTLTDAGIDKVLAILPTPVNANQQPVFIPNVTTSVVSDFEYGQIGNSYSTEITNAFGVDLSVSSSNGATPVYPPGSTATPTTTPEVYLGSVQIKKIDSISNSPLAGATFKIALTSEDASANRFIQQDAQGNLYAPGDIPSGLATNDYEATTDAGGIAEFNGLRLTDFTEAGNGTNISQANTTYYLMETVAPTGYGIIGEPIEVQASIDPGTVMSEVENILSGSEIQLPFTGGSGFIIVLLVAGTAIVLAFLIRRKPAKDA